MSVIHSKYVRTKGGLWAPAGRIPVRNRNDIELFIPLPPLKFEAFIEIELIDAKTQRVKQRVRFRNLITDAGLDRLGSSYSLDNFVFLPGGQNFAGVGTGSTAPAVTDTTLVSEISPASTNRASSNGGIANTYSYTAGTPDYHSGFRTFLFTESQGNGNLTEIGIFDANSGGNMWMRQLIKDSGGTPTTITKTASDQLRVKYELRAYPPSADDSFTRIISAVSYDIVVRPRFASSPGVWGNDGAGGVLSGFGQFTDGGGHCFALETNTLGARTSEPSGTQTQANTGVWSAYTNGNFYRDITVKFEPATANYASGIGSIIFYNVGVGDLIFQVSFTPKFAKDNTKRLTLINRLSWTRV